MKHQYFIQLIQLLERSPNVKIDHAVEILQLDKQVLHSFISELQQLGLPLQKHSENRIRLLASIEPIQLDAIKNVLDHQSHKYIEILPPLLSIDSTNQYLKNTKSDLKTKYKLCLAEHQSAGRGRQGKRWVSPIACNIYMSLHSRIQIPLDQIGGVSLMVGIAIAQALAEFGVDGLKLKWPNDIYWQNKKLAGILIESTKLVKGSVELIIGIGVNVKMPAKDGEQIDQAWVSLSQIINAEISRNRIIATIVNQLIEKIKKYERFGLIGFLDDWNKLDYLFQKDVTVKGNNGNEVIGQAVGINAKGELLILKDAAIIRIHAGDISVRQVDNAIINRHR